MLAVQGTLKGYDQLLNLVMDETIEYLRGLLVCLLQLQASTFAVYTSPYRLHYLCADPEDPLRITDTTRSLGLVVCSSLQMNPERDNTHCIPVPDAHVAYYACN